MVLYGAQIWCNLAKTDLENLDRVNRLAAKRMQDLCQTTKSEIGNLGLWTMQGYTDKSKLFFLQKLVFSSPNFIHKQLIIKRLFKFLYTGSHQSRGYIPNVFEMLDSYWLKGCLLRYADTGEFPEEQLWKKPVRESIPTFTPNAGLEERY